MIVLINGYSASASELAAGALKDNNRAVLVGEKSFGKGTVQILERLSDGSGIKFTTAKYYLPSGVTIDGVGVQPDILVPLTPEDKEDLQLNRAIEEIKKMIEKECFKKLARAFLKIGRLTMEKREDKKILVAQNKKAMKDFFMLDRYEAGIALMGCEVKSIRENKVNLKDCYARIKDGEIFVYNMHISPYSKSRIEDINPKRVRKLLLHRKEINKIAGKLTDKSLTMIPLNIFMVQAW